MRRFSILTFVTSIFLLAMGTSVAVAQKTSGVHFTRNNEPACLITNTGTEAFATCQAEAAGLGGGDVLLEVTLAGEAVYQCQNQGGNLAPGQNVVLVGPETTPVTIDEDQIKNGRATFFASTSGNPLTAAATVTGAEAGCPNDNWTGVNPTLEVTSLTFSAEQGGVVLFDCTVTGDNLTGTIGFEDWTTCTGVARGL